MTILQAIILGIVQGLSEFLPISSSAHIVFTQNICAVLNGSTIDLGSAQQVFLSIMLHVGTLIAVLIYFRSFGNYKRFLQSSLDTWFFKRKRKNGRIYSNRYSIYRFSGIPIKRCFWKVNGIPANGCVFINDDRYCVIFQWIQIKTSKRTYRQVEPKTRNTYWSCTRCCSLSWFFSFRLDYRNRFVYRLRQGYKYKIFFFTCYSYHSWYKYFLSNVRN